VQQAAARQAANDGDAAPAEGGAVAVEEPTQAPVVKSEHEKLGRNQPCWCGSGKKFKMCHGR
jgi:preprotein translocase subunit SecA